MSLQRTQDMRIIKVGEEKPIRQPISKSLPWTQSAKTKDTNNHCRPCLLRKEAPAPTEGVPAPDTLLGTCVSARRPAVRLRFPP